MTRRTPTVSVLSKLTAIQAATRELERARRAAGEARWDAARAAYRAVLELEPGHAESLESLVVIALQTGDPDAAEGHLRELLATSPDNARHAGRLARLLESRGRRGGAIACLQQYLDRQPGDGAARHQLGQLQRRAGELEAAVATYRECLALEGVAPAVVYNSLGIALGDLNRQEEARRALENALERDPRHIPALFNLALLEEEHGRWDAASVLFQRVLDREPAHAGALARLANGRRIAEPTDPLVRRMKRALRREQGARDREELLYALGKSMDDCGHYDKALDWYRQANAASRERVGPYRREVMERGVEAVASHCDADWLARIEAVSEAPHTFICGMFRSGSTLLEQILAAHPAVTPGGELSFFQRGAPDWPAALLEGAPAELGQAYEAHLAELFPGAERVSNKRPDNFLHLGLLAALFPGARFVETRRAPLDNCLSLYFQPLAAGQAYANDLLDCGHYYRQYRRLMEHWHALLPGRILPLDYEALVAGPEPVLRDVLEFLGLPWDPACLAFHEVPNRVRTASVHQVRRPLYADASGRWRHYEGALAALRDYLE